MNDAKNVVESLKLAKSTFFKLLSNCVKMSQVKILAKIKCERAKIPRK